MRADRLVAILLMLQTRGQVTAAEVADELEVSERTARRDLDALAMSGVPVYATPGRGGGWRLAGGGRTDLSGLNAAETRALFLVAGPAAASDPGVRAALRKLVRALPEPLRDRAAAASSAVFVDDAGWDRPGRRGAPPHLEAVQAAVVEGVQVRLVYSGREGRESERVVHPLGVVAKAPHWYLLGGTDDGLRTFRVDRIRAVTPIGEPVVVPDGFDLATEWRRVIDRVDEMRAPVQVRALADRAVVGILRGLLGNRVAVGAADESGEVQVDIRGHSIRSLVVELGGFGATLTVLEPAELREALHDLGAELVRTYAP